MAMRLRTLLGDHACTAALKNGSIKSDLVEFEFADYSPTHKGFKPMVREQAFDVSEMAIVTYLMARSFGKPLVKGRHVFPPSVDLNNPPPVPLNTLLSSQGPSRASHMEA